MALTTDGRVMVDDRMRTTRAGTYAAGDLTGRQILIYIAAHDGGIETENALGGASQCYDARAMPAAAFTDPNAACVGMTEARALGLGMAVRTSVMPLEFLPGALAARDTRGLVKLVVEPGIGRLLGAHILAPGGDDNIQTAALAIHRGLNVGDLAHMIFPYLTTVEGLKLAAQGFEKDVSKLSSCAG
jgi:pyruvate/2-oxoglutarate dehydrogenase complex dihydrolipoamide dehydrogenase (E3) component